jgi:transcriptional regulator with XRE-family HTH domain
MSGEIKSIAGIVGYNIYIRRKKRKLTQEALAEMVGVGQQSLSRMEKGKIAPRFDRLQCFAEVLGCSVADLFNEGEVSGGTPLDELQALMRPLSSTSQQVVVNIAFEVASAMLKLERTTP